MPSDAYPIRDEYLAALEADLAAMRQLDHSRHAA
jgi:hypothetical protein